MAPAFVWLKEGVNFQTKKKTFCRQRQMYPGKEKDYEFHFFGKGEQNSYSNLFFYFNLYIYCRLPSSFWGWKPKPSSSLRFLLSIARYASHPAEVTKRFPLSRFFGRDSLFFPKKREATRLCPPACLAAMTWEPSSLNGRCVWIVERGGRCPSSFLAKIGRYSRIPSIKKGASHFPRFPVISTVFLRRRAQC